jgi:hypothetical protein
VRVEVGWEGEGWVGGLVAGWAGVGWVDQGVVGVGPPNQVGKGAEAVWAEAAGEVGAWVVVAWVEGAWVVVWEVGWAAAWVGVREEGGVAAAVEEGWVVAAVEGVGSVPLLWVATARHANPISHGSEKYGAFAGGARVWAAIV